MPSAIHGPAVRTHRLPGLRPAGENFEFWQLWDAPGPERVHAAFRGQLAEMLSRSEQAARRLTAGGDPRTGLRAQVNAGLARLHLGDGPGAAAVLTAALAAAREHAGGWEEGYACYALGAVHRAAREAAAATDRLVAAERRFTDCGDVRAGGHARLALAVVAAEAGGAGVTEHLLAAVEAFRVTGARGSALTALWMLSALESGGTRAPDSAPHRGRPRVGWREHEPGRPQAGLQGLTRREGEVAALVASGLTNRQIAARMSIAERTVDTHVQRILAKSHCATRVQVAVLVAVGHGAGGTPSAAPRDL